jgi:hypothetical protein
MSNYYTSLLGISAGLSKFYSQKKYFRIILQLILNSDLGKFSLFTITSKLVIPGYLIGRFDSGLL